MHTQVVIAVAAGLAGCAVAEPPAQIDNRVHVLAGNDVIVADDSLNVAADGNEAVLSRPAGDILVSQAGDGVLRGLVAAHQQGDRILIDTTTADLSDAIIDGEAQGTLALAGDDKSDTFGLGRFDVDLCNKTPLDNASITVHVNCASLHVAPTLDLDLRLKARGVEAFDAILHGDLDASLDMDIAVHAVTIHPSFTLWSSTPAVFTQWIGAVPVVETATLSVGVRLDTTAYGEASAHLSGSAHLSLTGGVRWNTDHFEVVADAEPTLSGSLPVNAVLGQLNVRAYLYTQLDIKLYGLAGPNINVGPYVEVDKVTTTPTAKVGFYGEVGGQISVLGVKLPVIPRLALFDVSKPL